jgi:uncharacterized membrane protein YqjE
MRDFLSLLDDHFELFGLEAEFEIQQLATRVAAFLIAGLLALAAFLLVQGVLVYLLIIVGLKPIWALLSVAVFNCLVAAAVIRTMGIRPASAGRPFQGTREQARKSFQWIQNLF